MIKCRKTFLKDFRRALYREGNYRIHGKYKKYMIKKNAWRNVDTEGRRRKFVEFLQNKKSAPKESVVKSTYSKFTVPAIKTAKKTRPTYENQIYQNLEEIKWIYMDTEDRYGLSY